MVSQPTRGTDRRLTASATTNWTVQSGVTLKRITEHDGDNVLSLAFLQQGCGARPGLSYVPAPNRRYRTEVQSRTALEVKRTVAATSETDLPSCTWPRAKCAENGANWLDAAAERVIQLIAVRLLQTHAKTPIRPHAQV